MDKQKPSMPADFYSQTLDILGEDFWEEMGELIPNPGPRVDIYHTPDTVVVLVELPGLERLDQIGVQLEGQSLIVRGEIPCVYPVTDNRKTRTERFFGVFRRSLFLPKPVSKEGIKAKYSQGLLTIELRIESSVEMADIPVEFG